MNPEQHDLTTQTSRKRQRATSASSEELGHGKDGTMNEEESAAAVCEQGDGGGDARGGSGGGDGVGGSSSGGGVGGVGGDNDSDRPEQPSSSGATAVYGRDHKFECAFAERR